jgi:hypothetical protein
MKTVDFFLYNALVNRGCKFSLVDLGKKSKMEGKGVKE